MVTFINTFESFCSRMWLDYCDENNDPISAPGRLSREEYKAKYHDWLLEKWQNRKYGTNDE